MLDIPTHCGGRAQLDAEGAPGRAAMIWPNSYLTTRWQAFRERLGLALEGSARSPRSVRARANPRRPGNPLCTSDAAHTRAQETPFAKVDSVGVRSVRSFEQVQMLDWFVGQTRPLNAQQFQSGVAALELLASNETSLDRRLEFAMPLLGAWLHIVAGIQPCN